MVEALRTALRCKPGLTGAPLVSDAAAALTALRSNPGLPSAGVIVSAGRNWFPADPPGSFLRLSYSGAPEEQLVEGVRRLASAWPG